MKLTVSQRARYLKWLRKRGFKYPWRIVHAQRKTGIHPAAAAVLLKKESGGGRNVFGCDHGPGRAFCHQPVTAAKVKALLESPYANGVGPTQLTYKPFVVTAQRRGGAHRPYINMWTGFEIFHRYAKQAGIWQAARTYNGAAAYADDFISRYEGACKSLRGAGVIR